MAMLICPTCRKKVHYSSKDEAPYRPFCSDRCKLIDLHRWLNEEYVVREEFAHVDRDVPGAVNAPDTTPDDQDA
mgnify:CR=1 FL=1